MELDEMKLAWQTLSQQLDAQHALSQQLWRDRRLDRLRHGLRPLWWGQGLQIAFGMAVMLWGTAFWTTHIKTPQALLCGVFVQIFGMLMIVFAARLLSLAQRIDYTAPVLDIQRRLAAMRAWRVKVEAPVFILLGCFVWIPMLLMLLQSDADRVGFNLWEQLPGFAFWLTLNGVFSLVLALLVYGLLRKAGRVRWLENNFVGSAIRKAEATLEEIARFERE